MAGPIPGSVGAQKIGAAHRGSHAHDAHGGFAANPEKALEQAVRGGATTKEKYGAEFYSQIGKRGGGRLLEERGREHFAEIGRRGAQARWAREKAKKANAD